MEGNANVQTVIAEDIEVTGSIKCSTTIQFDGKLNGDLNAGGNAVIGASANIKGNITADSTVIQGQVNGNVTAKDRIELKSTAKLNGDIRARRLTVEDGATLVGKTEVNPAGSAGSTAPARPAAAGDARPAGEDEKAEDVVLEEEQQGRGKGLLGRK